jgi:hypothetical protein
MKGNLRIRSFKVYKKIVDSRKGVGKKVKKVVKLGELGGV